MTAHVVLRSAIVLGVIGAAAYGLLALSLPRASRGDLVVTGVLAQLDHPRGGGGVGRLDGTRFVASCRRAGPHTDIVRLHSGARLRLRGTRVIVARPAHSGRLPLRGAAADLAGSYIRYRAQLVNRLLRTGALPVPTLLGATPAYELPLGEPGQDVALFVDRRTLKPLAALYRVRGVRGFSRLLPARRGPGC